MATESVKGFAVTEETTISDIATAGSDITITSATYSQWGKVAMVTITFKSSSSLTNRTIATLNEGKRPLHQAVAGGRVGSLIGMVMTNGQISVKGNLDANESTTVSSTFIVA